jgi:hypothetical protein
MSANNNGKAYIITYTGKQFFLLKAKPEDIDVLDIAHALAMQCRWTGHSRFHYSIAQHAYYCSYIGPENEAFERLNHDDSEAYMGDMNRPLKHYTEAGVAYRHQEAKLERTIKEAFGIQPIESPSVGIADEIMLYAEKRQLLPKTDWEGFSASAYDLGKTDAEPSPTSGPIIEQWTPEQAEENFLRRWYELYRKRIN